MSLKSRFVSALFAFCMATLGTSAALAETSLDRCWTLMGGNVIDYNASAVWGRRNLWSEGQSVLYTCRRPGYYGLRSDYPLSKMRDFYMTRDIEQRWKSNGGLEWGLPTENTHTTPNGIGKGQLFAPKTGWQSKYISWSPQYGAHGIEGGMYIEWANQGWDDGWMGFPKTEEYSTSNCPYGHAGAIRQDFEGGYVCFFWNPDIGDWSTWSLRY